MTSHYDALGVAGDAGPDEIKRAYYDRARLYHPDAHTASSRAVRQEAERVMRSLNEAWSVLRSPSARRRYDRRLRQEARAASTVAGGRINGTARRPTAGGRPEPLRVESGSGFQYWLGSTGALQHGPDGVRRFNLKVTGSSLAPLRSLVPDRLIALHADEAPIDDRELEHLLGMRGLRFVDLSRTRVSDAGLVHLLGCRQLESLSLWDTAVTDDGLALLARLPNLCQVGLGNTGVTDEGLRHLRGLLRLRLLQLWGTDVAGPGLHHLHRLPQLEVVTLPWWVRGRYRRQLRRALPAGAVVA